MSRVSVPRVLHVAAEIFPLVKTGGLADVVGALPAAQAELGADVRLVLPGFPAVLAGVVRARPLLDIGPCFGALRVRLLLGRLPGSRLRAYVVDAPYLYRRDGGPYQSAQGTEWPDNLQRFALLGWVAAHLAAGDADPGWSADVVHAHDWHAALACAYIADHAGKRASSVFTVHNMAFQGLFPLYDWPLLGLASRHMSPAGMEFHGQLSFMKAGLRFADRVTTVSPRYAGEIATPEFGHGLDGVVRERGRAVSGVLNGIDTRTWDPQRDGAITQGYGIDWMAGKARCRAVLQQDLGLDADDTALLVVIVSRLTAQKGVDLVLAALPGMLAAGVQLAVQGTGESALEAALRAAQQAHPKRLHVYVGYDEVRAHRLIAGGDTILVPSRFEPCGLTQMYGMRYGTVPIVRRVGGLADTVHDADEVPIANGNGFVFDAATPEALLGAVSRALHWHADPSGWRTLQRRGMTQSFSWAEPARQYLDLYRVAERALPGSPG